MDVNVDFLLVVASCHVFFFLTLVVTASVSKPMLPERNSLVIDDFWCKYSMIGGPNG